MKTDMTIQAEQYISQGKKRRNRGRIVTALSVVVALATTYVLMLPGITMERDAQCGIEAHQHGDSCYTANLICTEAEREASEAELVSLACGFTPHQHTADCYRDGELACGKTDEYFHEHDAMCRDGEGNLICTLKENIKHEHTGSCYEEVTELTCETEETTGHEHTDDCYTLITAAQPACGMEENEGHQHTEACTTKTITCGQEEQQGHIHNDSCKQIEKTLTCTQTEAAAHTHGDSCYTTSTQLGCGKTEGEGAHTHGDSCYTAESNLTCGKTEGEGAHSHNDGCYTTENKQTCGKSEGEGAHDHSDACYSSSKKLACTTAEHAHADACKDAEGNIICTEAEHAHGEACYTTEKNLTCNINESAGHSHSDACYTSEKKLSCTTAETAGHAHSEACYTTANKLTCTTAETAGHVHSDACYVTTQAMSCSLEETAGHTHGDECYAETESIICGMAEGEGAHTHADTCYTLEQTCALSESEGAHVHSEACYPTENTLTCGKEEGEGAHTHAEECYTTERHETCDHPELHEHEADCFETDENNKRWCICELVELQEHQHSEESCLHTEVTSDAGHVHGEGCYEPALVCDIAEHIHTDECYPDTTSEPTAELTVSPEATAEPTLEPAVTAEPTMVPETTEEPVSRPENEEQDTTEPVVTPGVSAEPTKSQIDATATGTDLEGTAVPTATTEVVITAEPTGVPAETAKPTASPEIVATESELSATEKPAATLEPTSVPEATEQPSASNHVVTTETDLTPVPTAKPAPDADITTSSDLQGTVSVTTATDLNTNTEQFRQPVMMAPAPSTQPDAEQDVIYFEGERLYCGNPDHEHTCDCLFACGKVEHIHGDGMSVFAMFASAGDDHTHTTGCYDENGELVCELEEHVHTDVCLMLAKSTGTASDFGKYVVDADVTPGQTTTYNPETDSFDTNITFSFKIPNSVLTNDKTTVFTYNLPQNVTVPDLYLNSKHLISVSGGTLGGYFEIKLEEDGRYVVYVDLSTYAETLTDSNGESTGTLNFGCSISENALNNEGNVDVEFDYNHTVEIPEDFVEYPSDETAKYQISSSKKEIAAYDAATNSITYQVEVSSTKGTPDVIHFVDTMNLNNVQVESFAVTVADGNGQTVTVTNQQTTGNTLSMDLPKMDNAGKYIVTYTVKLKDFGISNVATQVNNSVKVSSQQNNGGSIDVESSSGTSSQIEYKSLQKSGSYDAAQDLVKWEIVVNPGHMNIAGATLTDTKLAAAVNGVTIEPANGCNNNNGTLTFVGVNGETNNNQQYTITYYTKPTQEYTDKNRETNSATLKNNDGTQQATDTKTVEFDRSGSLNVSKNGTIASAENGQLTIDWTVKIPVDADGMNENYTVYDELGWQDGQIYTYDQLEALYDSVKDLIVSGSFKVVERYGNEQPFEAINDGDTNGKVYSKFTFQLDKEKVNNSYTNEELELKYQSFYNYGNQGNAVSVPNTVKVGDQTQNGYCHFNPKEINPVVKKCLSCQSTDVCSHTGTDLKWEVQIYQSGNFEYIVIDDDLPEDVVLQYIQVGYDGNRSIRFSGTGAEDQDVDLVVADAIKNNYNMDVQMATYNPSTGKIVLKIAPYNGGNQEWYGTDKTLMLQFYAKYVGTSTTAVSLTNNIQVDVSENNTKREYGDDDQTINLTPEKKDILTKLDKRNPGNTSGTTNYNDYDAAQFGWEIRTYQDQTYDVITIEDTLPEGVNLVKVETGRDCGTVLTIPANAAGEVDLACALGYNDANEEKLQITGKYNTNTRKLTITVKKAEGWSNVGQVFGADKTLTTKLYCTIEKDKLPEPGETAQLTFANTANVTLTKGNETPVTDTATQTQNYNITGKTLVVKKGFNQNGNSTENDTIIKSSDGKLTWRVEVYQEDAYDSILIEDTLPQPAGVVELRNENGYCIALGDHTGYTLKLPDNAQPDNSGNIALVLNYSHNSDVNQWAITCDATYNVNTGKISIRINKKADKNFDSMGFGKTLALTYYCKVGDAYMPQVSEGEFIKKLGALTNNVTVSVDNNPYGNDSHTQDVTVTQNYNNVKTVSKSHNAWDNNSKILTYSVDINPEALELDPSKNVVTLIDTVGYQKAGVGKDLTLLQDSVKLYYANYDDNSKPIVNADGRLEKGKEVEYSAWTMDYTENKPEGEHSSCSCTMTLTVPDNRAMILEYSYEVSMNQNVANQELGLNNTVYIKGYDNNKVSDSTNQNEKWTYINAGGSVSTGHTLTLIKHDQANAAHVLEGVQFTIEKYEGNQWGEKEKVLTDANGKVTIQMLQTNSTYQQGMAYRVYETAAIAGYEEPGEDVLTYYFYWDAEGKKPAEIPEGAIAYNLHQNSTTAVYPVKIPNTKKSTSLEVEKVWLTASGEALPTIETPSSVMVQLRRYAIPENEWEELKAQNSGIDKTLKEEQKETTVTITVTNQNGSNAQNNFKYTLKALVGSTLEFDLRMWSRYAMGEGGWGHYPALPDYEDSMPLYENEGSYTVYHYSYTVKENMNLTGMLKVANNGGQWNTDDVNTAVSMGKITKADVARENIADYEDKLKEYYDRDFVSDPMKLTSAGNWIGTWENLDLEGTKNGQKVHYKYFVEESVVNGFSTSIDGNSADAGGAFVIENRQDNSTTETTSLRVEKEWYDSEGKKIDTPLTGLDGQALDKVEIRLYQKDAVTGREQQYTYMGNTIFVIDDATNWGFNFTNLPKKTVSAMGVTLYDYSYRVEEVTKGNFTTELVTMDGPITVTNANGTTTVFDKQITVKNSAQKTVSVEVEKVWADKTNAKDNVQVQLYREILKPEGAVPDDSFTHADATKLLDESNDWTFKWENLAAGSDTGDSYRYVVKEIRVDGQDVANAGYIVTYSGNGDGTVANNTTMTITNTPKTSISVEKVWAGNEQLDEVYVTLYKQNQDQQASEVETVEINADALWQHSWAELPAGEVVNGHYVQLFYYVVENAVEGYTTTYTVNGQTQSGNSLPVGSGTITITNSKEQDTGISINVTKQWQNADGSTLGSNLPASISFKLYRKTANGTAEAVKDASNNDVTYTLSANNTWSITIDGLDAADDQGAAYTYYVVEDAVEGFTTSYSNQTTLDGNGNVAGTVNGNAVTIINQKNQETTLTISKAWVGDQSGYTVYLRLLKKADDSDTYSYVDPTDYVPGGTTLQAHNGENLLPYAAAGNITLTGLPAGTYKVEEVAYKQGDGSVVSITTGMVLPWQVAVSSENVTIPAEKAQLTVTNTMQPQTTISVEKKWVDAEGNTISAPENANVSLQLYRNTLDKTQWESFMEENEKEDVNQGGSSGGGESGQGTLTVGVYASYYNSEDNRGTELAKASKSINENGIFSVKVTLPNESNCSGWRIDSSNRTRISSDGWKKVHEFTVEVNANENVLLAVEVNLENPTGISIEITEPTTDLIAVAATATTDWTQQGYPIAVPVGEAITLSSANEWKHTWPTQPAQNGNDYYYYYVQEAEVAGYEASSALTYDAENATYLYTVTNKQTEEVPETGNLTITKQWLDASSQVKQPASIIDAVYMKLLQNGSYYTNNLTQEANGVELVGDSEKYIKISPDSNDNWAATISNLPLNDTSGNPYTYTLEEYYLNGTIYTKVNDARFNPATANANGAVTVTNSVESLTVTKVWRDAQNQNDVTAPTDAQVTLELWRRPEGISGGSQDALVERFTLPINNAWTKAYDNLPSGYTYYAKETAATNAEAFQVYYGNNGETMAIQDSDGNIVVTNVQQETTTISARKVWQNADGTDMTENPGNVTMQLYRRSLTNEQWTEFVGSGGTGGNGGTSGGETGGGSTGGETDDDMVTLTFNVMKDHNSKITERTIVCPKGEEVTITISCSGVLCHYIGVSGPNNWHYGGNDQNSDKSVYTFTVNKEHTANDNTFQVNVSYDGNDSTVWSITKSASTFNLQRAATTDWMTEGIAVDGTQASVGPNGYTWPPQPSRDGNNYYYYYVQEVDGPEGYAASYAYTYDAENGTYEYTVTNTRDEQQPTNTNLVIRKVWVGAGEDKPETISFKVTRTDSVATENNITEFILNVTEKDGLLTATKPDDMECGAITIQKDGSTTADDWIMTISNLPQIQMAEGVITHNYIYTVEEVEIEGYDTTKTVTDDGTTHTFTNTKANDLKVEKVWTNQADKLESVRFELWRYKIPKDGNIETTPGDKTLNVEIKVDNYTLTSASKTGLKANDYVVWTAEYAHNNYTDFYPSDSSKNTITYNGMSIPFAGTSSTAKPYIFVHTIGPIGENGGNATWITDNWYHGTPGDGANVGQWVHKFEVLSSNYQEEPVGTETYVLNESNNWQMSFDSSVLIPSDDQYNYTYFVKEVVPANYDVTYSNNDGILSGTITMTNTKQAPLPTIGSLTVNKNWGEGTTPTESISFTLYRQAGENGTKEKVREEAYTLPTAENVWSMTIDELPLVDGSGTPYIYSVEETPMEGYYASYSGSVTLNAQPNQTGSITITNLVPGKTYTSLSTSKVWHDEIEAPGKGSPTTFDLYQVKTPKATTNAPAEYVDIKFRIVYREGTLSETTVRFPKGVKVQWIPTWSFNGDFHPGGTEGSTTYSMGSFSWQSGRSADVNVIRKHSEFENQKTEYTISIGEVTQNDTLVWTVENDFRPLGKDESSWTTERIRIWAHDFRVIGTTQKIREKCPTGTTIDNLPLEDADFTYSYFIEENGFDDYVKSYTGSLNSDGSQHITIHNTWIPTQLVVSKKWLDANMQVMTAPSGYSITYELYRLDGDAPVLVDTMTLPKSDGSWSHTYTKLADHVEYRVVETVVKRGDGVVITNQYNDMYKLIENGKTGEWTSTNGVEVELNGWHLDSQMEIGNQLITGYVLPETGGEGTHMYTGAGAMLVGIALTLLYKGNKRKRRAEE